jgi:hypothetical protein
MLKKNKSGLRICKLYVEKKIFYSLVFSPKTTVCRFHWFSSLLQKNTCRLGVLSTFFLSVNYCCNRYPALPKKPTRSYRFASIPNDLHKHPVMYQVKQENDRQKNCQAIAGKIATLLICLPTYHEQHLMSGEKTGGNSCSYGSWVCLER